MLTIVLWFCSHPTAILGAPNAWRSYSVSRRRISQMRRLRCCESLVSTRIRTATQRNSLANVQACCWLSLAIYLVRALRNPNTLFLAVN